MCRNIENPSIRCTTNNYKTRVYTNIRTGREFRIRTLGGFDLR